MPRAKPQKSVLESPLAKALVSQTREGLEQAVAVKVEGARNVIKETQLKLEEELTKNLAVLVTLRDSTTLTADEMRAANIQIRAIQVMLEHTHALKPQGPPPGDPRERPINILVALLTKPAR